MTKEIEDKFSQILSQVSESERVNNKGLARQTVRVLLMIAYIKALMKNQRRGI